MSVLQVHVFIDCKFHALGSPLNLMWSLQLEEINAARRSHPWAAEEQNITYSNQPAHSEGSFGHLHSNGTLHLG